MFNIINVEKWNRAEVFHHYLAQQTTFSLTKESHYFMFI